ncbi:MAG: acetoacetate decarboxylase family protein [Cyanobacteria bacterium RM1_2_2]|nr:acetoacetate decarboxylase family protein [Cyanobacteria bacterium RM1_2_2]
MPYPPAPWNLQGYSLQSLHLLDIDCVRPYIPADLHIFSVFPGKTLGGVYISSYGIGSTLQYNELIVVSALIWEAGKIGSWISHIYVDHPDSVAGGREIWGLPKQEAEFIWNIGNTPTVEVRYGTESLCTLSSYGQLPGWQQAVTIPAFGLLNTKLLFFEAKADLKLQFANVKLTVPTESRLSDLKLGQPLLGAYANSLQLLVQAPTVAKEISLVSESVI